MRQFVTEALEEKLKNSSSVQEKPWMKHIGKLADLREETAEIDRFIEETFENTAPEMWVPESKD
jgi:hypothetical protein